MTDSKCKMFALFISFARLAIVTTVIHGAFAWLFIQLYFTWSKKIVA